MTRKRPERVVSNLLI